MEKNKKLQALSLKKDFDILKKRGKTFSYQWMRVHFLIESKGIKLAWSLPSKFISQAPVRNRLKRWGRENLRKTSLKGLLLVSFRKQKPDFYKKLKRKDFDYVFTNLLAKMAGKN